ncbi:glycosyltransferase [Methanolobus sp. ZRKC2]|uniref:UDP-N-acetylglucosamine--N-acetylmuramyl- (pentapeptide) pyrophosphoryl-undecaprenol N-acetylglucosamine transferase n=1 Tax=Methanolobus sp. ZRKC2 TaxID=3125783 RepID=UPI00324F9899
MKVMIFVCGEGLGHTSRCISLARELTSAGHTVHFGAYGYSADFIESKGYLVHRIPSEVTLVGKAGTLNLKRSILATFKRGQFLSIIKITRLLKRIKPDAVISDSYYIGVMSAKARSIPTHLIINQSSMEQFFMQEGISSRIVGELVKKFYSGIFKRIDGIIIPDFPIPHTICRRNLEFEKDILDKVLYSGPLIGKEYEEVDELDLKKPHILSTLGGFGYREPIFRKVIQAAEMDKEINYTLLSGPNVDPSIFESLPKNVKVLEFIDDQFPYLKSSNIVIAPGGHSTMMEAFSFGVPMITFPDMNHTEQQNNSWAVEEDGLGKKLDYSTSPEKILSTIQEILQDSKYRDNTFELKTAAKELNGPTAICKMLESELRDNERDEGKKRTKIAAIGRLRKKISVKKSY